MSTQGRILHILKYLNGFDMPPNQYEIHLDKQPQPLLPLPQHLSTMANTTISYLEVNGTDVFYRQAGPLDVSAPTLLLLHGFPSSSHQFRNLIPILALMGYRVLAPDLPGFGFTKTPPGFDFTFDNLAKTIDGFVSELALDHFALYVFDYGAPTGFRLALDNPDKIAAIVSQNGNAYEEGFGQEFWAPLMKYWESGSEEDRNALRSALTFESNKWQYTNGSPHPEEIQPESYYLDQALLNREGQDDIQLDLFYDYRTNVEKYPAWQKYLRESDVPVLAAWGEHDTIFVPPGAEAFRRDVKNFDLHFIDAGHFAIETNEQLMADTMHDFFNKYKVFKS